VKQSVHGISLTLRAALEAERRGEGEAAREMFKRALAASRETEFQISRPYDELQTAIHGEDALRPKEYLRHRLERFGEYFSIKTHEDLQAPLEALGALELAAVYRVVVEAFWNVAKHSGARNMYLESRRVGDLLLLRVRDDGRGFDPSNPPRHGPPLPARARRGGRGQARRDLRPRPRDQRAAQVPHPQEPSGPRIIRRLTYPSADRTGSTEASRPSSVRLTLSYPFSGRRSK